VRDRKERRKKRRVKRYGPRGTKEVACCWVEMGHRGGSGCSVEKGKKGRKRLGHRGDRIQVRRGVCFVLENHFSL
jgi:hypothetical protein